MTTNGQGISIERRETRNIGRADKVLGVGWWKRVSASPHVLSVRELINKNQVPWYIFIVITSTYSHRYFWMLAAVLYGVKFMMANVATATSAPHLVRFQYITLFLAEQTDSCVYIYKLASIWEQHVGAHGNNRCCLALQVYQLRGNDGLWSCCCLYNASWSFLSYASIH